MANDSAPSTPNRGERRRAETRSRLISAAQAIIAKNGAGGLRVSELTELADVGFGSFYNHFADKEDLVAAVAESSVAGHQEAVDAYAAVLDDPAEVIAVANKHFVRLAASEPTVGWVIVRLDASHKLLPMMLGPDASSKIGSGIVSGRFSARDIRFTLEGLGGALTGVMRCVLEGRAPADADVLHAEFVLRVLGLSSAEAAEIAGRDMPGSTS